MYHRIINGIKLVAELSQAVVEYYSDTLHWYTSIMVTFSSSTVH